MTRFEYDEMQKGDAVRVTRDGIARLLSIAWKRNGFIGANDGNEYELDECEPILLSDVEALHKLGFRKQFGFMVSDVCYCFGWLDIYADHISIWMDELGTTQRGVVGYKYLHQAQQKFRELHNENLKLKYDK